jgi:5-methylcytosine-specific restriction enzyme subunit McrC
VIESTWTSIDASDDELALLRELGVKLARNRNAGREQAYRGDGQRSVIHVRKTVGRCEVRVIDAVGIIAMPTLTLDVTPKVPAAHLLYLLERAGLLPRLDAAQATLQADRTLFELIARWYVIALNRVLEEGLARDYRTQRGLFPAVRGRVLAMPTAQLYYRGRLEVVSEYQDYDFDTPLNRLLLHATRLLVAHPGLPKAIRAQARRAILRMDGIGPLQQGDGHVRPDRRTIYYRDAALLAKHLIDGVGRGLLIGAELVWTFLLRTPEAVEEGLRRALIEVLPSAMAPAKYPLPLNGTNMTLNPDLIFGKVAVAEVKYKLSKQSWRKDDLYQLVAFATGFEVANAAMIDFAHVPRPLLETAEFGSVRVAHLTWPALADRVPSEALKQLAQDVVAWSDRWRSRTAVTH